MSCDHEHERRPQCLYVTPLGAVDGHWGGLQFVAIVNTESIGIIEQVIFLGFYFYIILK